MGIVEAIKKHKAAFAVTALELAALFYFLVLLFVPSAKGSIEGDNLRVDGMFPGLYEVSAGYEAYSDGAGSGEIAIMCGNPGKLLASPIALEDGAHIKTERIWIKPGLRRQSVVINTNYREGGIAVINSLQITEKKWFRLTRIAGLMLVFAALDLVIFTMLGAIFDLDKKQKIRLLLLTGTALLASLPCFADFMFAGHDLTFHLSRIMAIADELRDGQLPVRIFSHAFNEHGYAVPLFYGQLLLCFPAVLYLLGMPLQTAYSAYMLAVNIATAAVAYYSFGRMAKDKNIAVAAAFLYTICPYRFTDLYVRSSVGEYSAMIFLPLLIYGFWNIYTKDNDALSLRDELPLIIALTGLIQTHTLSCAMAAVFILIFVLICARKTFVFRRLMVLLQTAFVTALLNLWFIVPFLASSKMELNISDEAAVGMTDQGLGSEGAYLDQIFALYHPGDGASNPGTTEGDMALTIGFALMAGLALAIIGAVTASDKKSRKAIAISTGFAAISLWLSTVYFPWNKLCEASKGLGHALGMLQFPWRFLAFAMTFAVAALAMGLKEIKKAAPIAVAALVCICLVTETSAFADFVKNKDRGTFYSANEINNMRWDNLYLPLGTDVQEHIADAVAAPNPDVTVTPLVVSGRVRSFTYENPYGEADISLPVFFYDNYRAKLAETGEMLELSKGDSNDLVVTVPGGSAGTVELTYREPFAWRLTELASLVTLALLLGYLAKGNRKHEKILQTDI